jgi:hypothetical protein
MSGRYFIHVPAESQGQPLLSTLENVLPVKFVFSDSAQLQFAGKILTAMEGETLSGVGIGVSTLTVPPVENAPKESGLIDLAIRFSDDPEVPFPFRGRSLRTKVLARPTLLSVGPDEKSLATLDQGPVWICSERKGTRNFRSAFALPAFPADGSLQDVLNGGRFLEVLPLLHWLRTIGNETSSVCPPLRACFIFDDPNLHWPHYGYVDYRQLAAKAEKENYHVAFATIPLDTWFTHNATARIFREHRRRLSLLIHGNNHAKRELARPYTEPERIFLLKQAIHRIERLERRSGLLVSRVMVPPHGACSEEMLAALPLCGFAGACISHSSLRAHNRAKAWTKSLGYLPSELIQGCPVLPRWGVKGDLKNTILLAAYLNQAIILRGHHQDLKDGPELLDELARFVNGLGSVEWLNMTAMVGSDYSKQSAEIKTQAKPFSSIWFVRRLLTEGRDRLLANGS